MSVIKNAEQIEKMRNSGALLARCLDTLVMNAKPGVSGKRLDGLAEEFIRDHHAIPAFKNYAIRDDVPGFPGSICFSRNHVLVHGIPHKQDVIQEKDIITIDCGISLEGLCADAARLFGVGELSTDDRRLVDASHRVALKAVEACRVGNRLGDIGNVIQTAVALENFRNVIQFSGHAIGKEMHEPPQVPNFGRPKRGLRLQSGMVFCLEPMLMSTKAGIGQLRDGWTVITLDKSRATHIEHMVLITDGDPEILTANL
jgi:methionyl aminopeptidase